MADPTFSALFIPYETWLLIYGAGGDKLRAAVNSIHHIMPPSLNHARIKLNWHRSFDWQIQQMRSFPDAISERHWKSIASNALRNAHTS